jgi:hypothetical protein
MTIFKLLRCLFVQAVLVHSAASAADGTTSGHPPDADKIASDVISARAAGVHGAEYPDHREWGEGDLNGDSLIDYVVLYTIENGNNYSMYMMALLRQGEGYRTIMPVKVGGRGKRLVHIDSIAGGRIKLRTEGFGPKDPLYCPGLKSETEYSLKNGALSERGRRSPHR